MTDEIPDELLEAMSPDDIRHLLADIEALEEQARSLMTMSKLAHDFAKAMVDGNEKAQKIAVFAMVGHYVNGTASWGSS